MRNILIYSVLIVFGMIFLFNINTFYHKKNCSELLTLKNAKKYYQSHPTYKYLDRDNDGIPCEKLK